jgi:hypothetical protein
MNQEIDAFEPLTPSTRIFMPCGDVIASFQRAKDAVACIGPMARVLGVTLEIVPAPSDTVAADLPRNVSLQDIEKDNRHKLVARP